MNNEICHNLNLDYANFRVGDSFRVPFYCYLGAGLRHSNRTVAYKFGMGEACIEDIIAKLEVLKQPIDNLKRFIRDDYQVDFGIDRPKYKIFSVEAKFPEMFPIVCYQLNEAGQMKYFAHPQINLMVQRYV